MSYQAFQGGLNALTILSVILFLLCLTSMALNISLPRWLTTYHLLLGFAGLVLSAFIIGAIAGAFGWAI